MVFRGDQSSLTEYKEGGGLMTVIERGTLEYYRA